MAHRKSRSALTQYRAIFEAMEKRVLMSATVTTSPDFQHIIANPIGGKHLETPLGYTSPAGVPITPALMRNAYGLGTYGSSSVVFNTAGGSIQGDGSGQTIALIEAGGDPNIASDLVNFDAYYGLPNPPSFQQLNQTGGTGVATGSGDVIGELCLDVEWAHVMAPMANITLYCGNNLYACMQTAASAPGVSVISVSYGIGGTQADSFFYTPAGHQGVTYTASTGDSGGEVVYPSASAAVVAVGGTSLYTSGSAYSSESAWSDGGGGINTSDAQPKYQNGEVNGTSSTYRVEPDVALDADPNTGVAIYDSYNEGTAAPWGLVYGGTSLSSPVFAGIVAVADQGRVAAGLGTLDGFTQTLPRLYEMYAANYSTNFHDVVSGNNSHPTTKGYDLATGLGSPKNANFVLDLAGAATVTGQAYVDNNGNGIYDAGDTVLANQSVYIDVNKTGVKAFNDPTATTDANGMYTFSDVIGSESGIISLATPISGYIHTAVATLVSTSYDQTSTVNLVLEPNPYTATATPSTVTGSTTQLSVVGNNPSNSAAFTYTWSVVSQPTGSSVVFSINGKNAASTTTATFNLAGDYVFKVVINDGQQASVTSTTPKVSVISTTLIQVTPQSSGIGNGQSETFSALAFDQYGSQLNPQPTFTWSLAGTAAGTINPTTGVYNSPIAGPGTDTVVASEGGFSGEATVTDLFTKILGTTAADTIQLVRSGANLLVYEHNLTAPRYNTSFAAITSVLINGKGGADSINIDFSGDGSPVPVNGITVNETGTPSATLTITGSTGNDTASVSANYLVFNGGVVTYNSVASIVFDGNAGTDSLTQNGQPAASVIFNGGLSGGPSSSDTLNVESGIYTFPAPTVGAGVEPLSLAALNISGTTVVIPSAASHSDRWALTLGSLDLEDDGYLDLGSNDMVVHNASVSDIFSQIQSGYAGGSWSGSGIISSAAATNPSLLTTLGVISNDDGTGTPLYNTFDGEAVSATDVLVKYTYYGDANLDGKVDGSDYSRIDSAFLSGATGWSNGDFNYDGLVNGSDYTLIDNAFNVQGASLAASVASLTYSKPGVTSNHLTAIAVSPAGLFASKPISSDTNDSVWSQLWKKNAKVPSVLA